jgi:hypothetical protein
LYFPVGCPEQGALFQDVQVVLKQIPLNERGEPSGVQSHDVGELSGYGGRGAAWFPSFRLGKRGQEQAADFMVGPGVKINPDAGVLGLKFPDEGREDPGIPFILPPLGEHQNPFSFSQDWDAPADLPQN